MKSPHISNYKVERLIFYLTVLSGFMGPAFFSINLGLFTLFPYRVFLVLLWMFFILRILVQDKFFLPRFRVKSYLSFFFVWLAYAVLTLAWAKDSAAAIEDVVFLTMAISVILFTVYYARKMKDFKRLYWLWVIVFFGFILFGFYEHLAGNHLPVSKLYQTTDPRLMNVPTGVFHNQNNYAMALTLSIPFAIAFCRYKKRVLAKLFGLFLVLSACYLIVITGSRANILAVLLEVIFLWLVFLNSQDRTKYVIVVVGLVALSILVIPGLLQSFQNEILSNLNSLVVNTKMWRGSIRIRFNLVRNGLVFLRSTWGFGVGAGNAEYWMANFGKYFTEGVLSLHNWWLENLTNYGIFIFSGYLAVYFSLLWNLWKGWRDFVSSREKMISEALMLSLVGFSVASFSPSSIMAFKPQWFLIAFGIAFINYYRRKRKV